MPSLKRSRVVPAVLLLLAAGMAGASTASGRMDEAVALYHDARYAEALQVLDEIEAASGGSNGSAPPPDDQDVIDQYRALCLLALDRQADARSVLRRLVERRPEFPFPADELPPRFLSVVRETQADVLPALARAEYRAGKASYDRRAYSEAERRLRRVVNLAETEGLAPEARASIDDLADVARGFLGLIEGSRVEAVGSLPPAAFRAAPRAPASPYSAADRDVTPPVAVRQDLPAWRSPGSGNAFHGGDLKGTLEVIITESGRVEAARLVKGLHPLYDAKLVAAARRWEYRPATRDGRPVRFRKVLDVQLVDERRN